MKKIGLIGGLSYISTIDYYRIINEKTNKILGGQHSAEIVLVSFDFEKFCQAFINNNWDLIKLYLIEAMSKLVLSGCSIIAICCNSVHRVFFDVEKISPVKMLHIIDPTIDAILEKKLTKVALLGTKYTMSSDYKKYLSQCGIEVVLPQRIVRERINDIIFSEICQKRIKASSRNFLKKIIESLVDQGAQGVVLACTELHTVLEQSEFDVPLFITTLLHAEKIAIEACESSEISISEKYQSNFQHETNLYIVNVDE